MIMVFKVHGFKHLYIKSISELKKRITKRQQKNGYMDVEQIIDDRFSNIRPMKSVHVEIARCRFNVVTDSLKRDSLFGGVATALILAVLFCKENNFDLRIITRTSETDPADFENFLDMMNLEMSQNISYYTDYDHHISKNFNGLEVSDNDIFMATSWWSAQVIKGINLRNRFFYILQEVESFFYPNGDDQLLCEEILESDEIDYIINSKLLFDYYRNNGYDMIVNNCVFFEPAFIKKLYSADEHKFKKQKTKKYRLFFYARPNNSRNLFYRGIDVINEALNRGIIEDNWEIFFAGSDVPDIVFSNGVKPIVLGQMNWKKYSSFLKTIDLGLCLMYTPHPSYPPLDIAASGGVVLTNAYKNKKTLHYSSNIITSKIEKEEFLRGLEDAVTLSLDFNKRKKNYQNNSINRNWQYAMSEVIVFMHNKQDI